MHVQRYYAHTSISASFHTPITPYQTDKQKNRGAKTVVGRAVRKLGDECGGGGDAAATIFITTSVIIFVVVVVVNVVAVDVAKGRSKADEENGGNAGCRQ
jgi:hypothetical protein